MPFCRLMSHECPAKDTPLIHPGARNFAKARPTSSRGAGGGQTRLLVRRPEQPVMADALEPGRQHIIDVDAYPMHTGCVDIEFDPVKAATNLRKHKVSFSHAEQALRDSMACTIEDPDSTDEQRFVTLGTDALGRLLVVVHSPRGSRTRIISARKASPGESRQYHA